MMFWSRSCWLILLAAVTLSACGFLPGSRSAEPARTYLLEWPGQFVLPPAEAAGCDVLLVNSPASAPGFATTRMAYVERPYQLDYFAYHQWASTPASMLQPLVTRAMESSGLFEAVVEAPSRVQPDFRLETELLALQQVFNGRQSRIQLDLRARLFAEGKLLASRILRLEEPAPEETPYGGVLAANHAVEELLRSLVLFVDEGVEQYENRCRDS